MQDVVDYSSQKMLPHQIIRMKKCIKVLLIRLKKCIFVFKLIYNTMLKRKIESVLLEWKTSGSKKPLVIKGIRQCGKTYIVQKFARENYKSVVYMNFILEPDKKSALPAI